jgi:alpha-mannosidase
VALDAGASRVDWRVQVDNRSRDHRLRMLFPVGTSRIDAVHAETAFGVARREARRAVPAASRVEVPVSYAPTISFTDAGDASAGAIVYGEGLMEYEALTPDSAGTRSSASSVSSAARLGVTLLRAVGDLSRNDLTMRPSGHAGPGLATPGAQCLGQHEFRLAFEPRGARPPASALFGRAADFLTPPLVASAAGAAGDGRAPLARRLEGRDSLHMSRVLAGLQGVSPGGAGQDNTALARRRPSRPDVLAGLSRSLASSWLEIEPVRGSAVLSACKRADERPSVVIRLFNPDDTDAVVRVRTMAPLKAAWLLDLLEERQHDALVRDGAAELTLGPHRIATLELVPQAADDARR